MLSILGTIWKQRRGSFSLSRKSNDITAICILKKDIKDLKMDLGKIEKKDK